MILAKIEGTQRQMLAVGLSGENVTRLAAGEPILKRLEDIGFPGIDLVIVYGKTEDEAKADIARLLAAMREKAGS